MAVGSRGDVQPFLALSAGLVKAGAPTLVLTNANLVDFASALGAVAKEVYPDTKEVIMNTPGLLECMKEGNILSFLQIVADLNKKMFPENYRKVSAAIEDFRPDVVLAGCLSACIADAIGAMRGIPVIRCDLFGFLKSGDAPSLLNEPAWTPRWCHRALNRLYDLWTLKGQRDAQYTHFAEVCPELLPFLPKNLEQYEIAEEFRPEPMLIASSPLLVKQPKDVVGEVLITGHWVVPEEDGMRFGGEHFAGVDELAEFLASGPAPVYIGWGSMICVSAEFMASLAVRAVKLAGLRAVVLGGWAMLDEACLRGQPDSDELLEYARRNVLFTKAAPHEWLFQRCAATVHHGGAGTTAAALRSGRPTIITPCGFDQPMHARTVAASGAGMALPQLVKVTPTVLADALRQATTDNVLIAQAAELGAKLREEDGVSTTLRVLDEFFTNQVATGAWPKKVARMHEAMRKFDSPGLLTRLGFFCAKLCTNSIKSQVA